MIVKLSNQSEAVSLHGEELRAIRGGRSSRSASFPCRVIEGDGSVREKQVSSIQECLDFAGI